MLSAPFPEMRKFLSQYPARSSLDFLGDVTQGVFRRVLEKYVHMVCVYSHVNNLDAHFRACTSDNCLCDKNKRLGISLMIY